MIPGNDDAFRSVSLFAKMMADACIEGAQMHQEKLRASGNASDGVKDETEKKVSRFEGDIDLKGVDAADLEALEATEESPEALAAAGTTDAAAPAAAVVAAPAKPAGKIATAKAKK